MSDHNHHFSALGRLLRDLQDVPSETHDAKDGTAPSKEFPSNAIGDYRVLDKLGEGGMGIVYRAFDVKRQKTVALKTLHRIDPAALHRFKHEFRSLADLSHRNLVTLYELLCERDRWCFTMELVEGVTFGRYVAGYSRLDDPRHMDRIRDALRQLAEGVAALHGAQKLHRDIKPGNVLVTPDGRVVLVDFGLAAELNRTGSYQSSEHHLIGTVAYMSPEQAMGGPVSAASDWYSVGVMLYEAITGHLPFEGSMPSIIDAKLNGEPVPPAAVVTSAPNDLSDLAVALLRRDPAARVDERTVLERLSSLPMKSATKNPRVFDLPFVGRDRELAALREAFQATRQGKPVIVYLHGSSGAGKTALMNRFIDNLKADPRVLIFTGRCYEQESVPFKALDNLVDHLTDHLQRLRPFEIQALLPRDVQTLARVFPVLRKVKAIAEAPIAGIEPVDPKELRRRASAALRELLARLGDRHPLVLIIDDLQWGDVDSASLLSDILTPPDAPVFLGIGCYRTEDAAESPFLKQLRQSRTGASAHDERDIAIGPLHPDEAQGLTITLLNAFNSAKTPLTEAIVQESAGQPFLVYELVEHVNARANGVDLGESVSLMDVLWHRILQLPEEARRLLEIVVISGKPIRTVDACDAAGLVADERVYLPTLRSTRLIRGVRTPRGDSIEAYHDRVRECVVRHLTTDAIKDHHSRLAARLVAIANPDREALALHLDRAGECERAAGYYVRAATDAADGLAFDHAAVLFRRALELRQWSPKERCNLRTQLADSLANAGRGALAAVEYLLAAQDGGPADAIELQRRAALQLLTSGHVDEGLARLAPVLASVGMRLAKTPWQALASLLFNRLRLQARGIAFDERPEELVSSDQLQRIDIGWSAVVGLSIVDPIRAADFQTRNLLMALRVGEPLRIARALAVEAGHLASTGSDKRAASVLTEAERLANEIGRPYARGISEMSRGTVHYFAERWRESLQASKQAQAIFRHHCTGVAWEIATASAFTLWSLAKMGEVAELRRICPALLKDARERGDRYAVTNLSTQIMALVQLAADDPEEARISLDSAMRQWSQNGYHVQHHDALLATVPIELYSDKPEVAWERVGREWSAFRWSLLSQIQDVRIEMLQMRAYAALAMAARTKEVQFVKAARRDARRLRKEKLPWTRALADYVDGTAVALGGNEEAAAKFLTASASAFDAVNAQLYCAATRTRLASLLKGSEGAQLESDAERWFQSQGIQDPDRMSAAYAPGFTD